MMARMLLLISCLLLFLPLDVQARLNVVSTTQDPAALVTAIGGERINLTTLCKGYQDPHFLDAKPSYMVALSRAELLLSIGLELEVGYLPTLISGARNPKIGVGAAGNLDLSKYIIPLEVGGADRSQGDIHPGGNPHYWLDPENARLMARAIASRLSELDPAGKTVYTTNLAAFEKALSEKQVEWAHKLAPLAGKPILTFHRSWSYLVARYKLNVVGYVEPKPGIPPSPSHTLELIKLAQAQGIKIILMESYYDKRAPELITSKTGARLVVVPSSVGGEEGIVTYFQLMDRIVAGIEQAMR